MQGVIYTLTRIDGDYAVLVTSSGDENRVARALLPDDADEGDSIVYQNFGFYKKNEV